MRTVGLKIQRQGGFTLVELMIVMALLVLLTVALIFAYNPAKSKGQVLFSLMSSVSNAAARFNTDTSCYPYATGLLFDTTLVSSSTSDSCSAVVQSSWNGPYMKVMPENASGDVTVPQVGPNAYLDIEEGTYLANAPATQYSIFAHDVPNDIATQTYIACGGAGSNCVEGAANAEGTGVTYIQYVFAEEQ